MRKGLYLYLKLKTGNILFTIVFVRQINEDPINNKQINLPFMLIIKKNYNFKHILTRKCSWKLHNTGHNYNETRTIFGFVLSWVEHISYYCV